MTCNVGVGKYPFILQGALESHVLLWRKFRRVVSLILLSQCFPNPFFFLAPKNVIIPLLHSGLTETIQKYSSACWISADPGCT